MANLSANALFHFTPREFLLSKFEHGFIPCLLTEFDPMLDYGFFTPNVKIHENGKLVENADQRTLYIPMICFCDIPLSSLSFHMDVYSCYGIGMKKEWGIKKGINPVMYINPDSLFFSTLSGPLFSFDLFMPSLKQLGISDEDLRNSEALYQMTGVASNSLESLDIIRDCLQCYLKPFECRGLYRGKYSNYLYYNEKEWRYAPIYFREGIAPIHSELSNAEIAIINNKLSNYPLKFSVEDIKYIIVRDDNDIEFLIEGLNEIKDRTGSYTDKEINLLSTKIFTEKSLNEDA